MVTEFDSTLGAAYVGVTTTACLYGIFTLHGYTYWNRPNQDSLIAKISISLLWLVDTAKLVCATHIGYRLLITEYENDPEALFHSTWSVNTQFLLTALAIFGAQLLSAYHTSKSSEHINLSWASPRVIQFMGIAAGFFAFIQLGFGIAMSSLAWVYWDIREMDKHRWISSAWTGSTSLCSIIITYNLSALLASTDMRIHDTVDLINEFLRCLIHTGLLSSIFAVVNILAFTFMGQYVRIAVNFPLGTLHLITTIAVLNARSRETPDLPVFEEYEFGAAGYKAEPNNGVGQVNVEGSLRVGKLSIKIPPRLLRREPAITVLVQQETHIIGISEINSDDRNSTLRHHEDSDDTESVDYRADLGKSQTPTI